MPDQSTPGSYSSSSYPAGDIGITLTPSLQRDYTEGTTLGFRLHVLAWNEQGLDDSVFRYYRKPTNPTSGVSDSIFSGVCSWPDMEELPQDEPEADTSPAGFRLNFIDLVVESETVANEVWTLIQNEVQELLNTIKAGETLESTGDVRLTAV